MYPGRDNHNTSTSRTTAGNCDGGDDSDVDSGDVAVKQKTETIERLKMAISKVRQGVFSVNGQVTIPVPLPYINVEGIGSIGWPVNDAAIDKIKSLGEAAPFGKGSQTLVDTNVRNAKQIDSSMINCCDLFHKLLNKIKGSVCKEFELPPTDVDANLHKLVLYSEGGHFDTHTDTEKEPRMFATLIVELPCDYQGGYLEIKHNGMTRTYLGSVNKNNSKIRYVALYSSCKHRVLPVTQGNRLVMLFNLVKKSGRLPESAKGVEFNKIINETVQEWPAGFIAVHKLEYEYSSANEKIFRGNDLNRILALKDAVDEHGEPLFDIVMGNAEKTQEEDETYGCENYEANYDCVLNTSLSPSNLNLSISLDLHGLDDEEPDYSNCNFGFFPHEESLDSLFDGRHDEQNGEGEFMGNYAATVEYIYRTKLIAVYPRKDRFLHGETFSLESVEDLQQTNPSTFQSTIRRHLQGTQKLDQVKEFFQLYVEQFDVESAVEIATQMFKDSSRAKLLPDIINEEQMEELSMNSEFVDCICNHVFSEGRSQTDREVAAKLVDTFSSQVLQRVCDYVTQPNDVSQAVAVALVNRNSLVKHEKQSELLEKFWPIIANNITALTASQLSDLFESSRNHTECRVKLDKMLQDYQQMPIDTHRVAVMYLKDGNRDLAIKAASDLLDRKEDWNRIMSSKVPNSARTDWQLKEVNAYEGDLGRNFVTTILDLNDDTIVVKFIRLMLNDTSPMGSNLLDFATNTPLSCSAVSRVLLGLSEADVTKNLASSQRLLPRMILAVDDPKVWTHFLDIIPLESLSDVSSSIWSDVGAKVLNMGNEEVVASFLRKILCLPVNMVQGNVRSRGAKSTNSGWLDWVCEGHTDGYFDQHRSDIRQPPRWCVLDRLFREETGKAKQTVRNVKRISKQSIRKCVEQMTDEELRIKVSITSKDWIATYLPTLEDSGKTWERLVQSIPLTSITKTLASNIDSKVLGSREGQELVFNYLCRDGIPALIEAILYNAEVILLVKSLVSKVTVANDEFNNKITRCLTDMRHLGTLTFYHKARNEIVPGFKKFMEDSSTSETIFKRLPVKGIKYARDMASTIKSQPGVTHSVASGKGIDAIIQVKKSCSKVCVVYCEIKKLWNDKFGKVGSMAEVTDLTCDNEPATKKARVNN